MQFTSGKITLDTQNCVNQHNFYCRNVHLIKPAAGIDFQLHVRQWLRH